MVGLRADICRTCGDSVCFIKIVCFWSESSAIVSLTMFAVEGEHAIGRRIEGLMSSVFYHY